MGDQGNNVKKTILILTFFLSAAAANASEFALLNTDILGKGIDQPVVVLSPHAPLAIKPTGVFLDTNKGNYHAATLHFRNVKFTEILQELTDLYGRPNFEPSRNINFATWRIVSEKFAVSLSEEKNEIKVVYVYFQTD